MKSVKITFTAEVEDDKVDELKKTVDHHLDHLIDVDSWPEIKNIYNAKAVLLAEED